VIVIPGKILFSGFSKISAQTAMVNEKKTTIKLKTL